MIICKQTIDLCTALRNYYYYHGTYAPQAVQTLRYGQLNTYVTCSHCQVVYCTAPAIIDVLAAISVVRVWWLMSCHEETIWSANNRSDNTYTNQSVIEDNTTYQCIIWICDKSLFHDENMNNCSIYTHKCCKHIIKTRTWSVIKHLHNDDTDLRIVW